MVKHLFVCEICNSQFAYLEEAEQCEARGFTGDEGYVAGLILTDEGRRESLTFAGLYTGNSEKHGHWSRPVLWWFRGDYPAGDDNHTRGDVRLPLEQTNTDLRCAIRARGKAISLGLKPLIVDCNGEVVEWK